MIQINLQNQSQTQKTNLWLPKGKWDGSGIFRVNNKVQLYSTGNYLITYNKPQWKI